VRPAIRVINAGAGSGKTHRLTHELAQALDPSSADAARPEGVLATTFTRKAAAELCARARRTLFEHGRAEEADRIADGLIGTVNSVCGRLLARFAFEAGLSPELRVIEEQDQQLLFNQALAADLDDDLVDELMRLDHCFGYDFPPPKEERKDWRYRVRAIIDAARCNDLDASAVREAGLRSLSSLLALFPRPDPGGGEALDHTLRAAIEHALSRLPASGDDTKATREYVQLLRRTLVSLREPEGMGWSEWVALAKEAPAKKSQPLVHAVKEAVAGHARHPRLHDDLTRYVTTIFELAANSLETYQRWKRERGLIDFIDQEALTLALLAREDVRSVLAAELDATFVDEFQDTSPLQLAVFLQLASLATRSVWVGDPKQSIYAFRGADPELMDTVVAVAGQVGPGDVLTRSYRSRPALVAWTSEVFAGAFAGCWPRERIVLEADRTDLPGLSAPLQCWAIPTKNVRDEAAALAVGVGTLLGRLSDPAIRVVDPETRKLRDVRPGDVAVLCRTNVRCAEVAAALERAGIRAALARAGLMRTPEAILTLAAVKLLIDGHDSLARAEIVALTSEDPEPEAWLSDRLAHLAAGRPSEEWAADHPVIVAVERLRSELGWLAPAEALDRVIRAIDAPRLVLGWGRADLRLGNLDALRRSAGAYEEQCVRRGAAATVAGMLAWFDVRARARVDDQSEGLGDESVAVLTWHGAKGLEWPVVVVSDLDKTPTDRLWEVTVESDAKTIDPARPLAGRWIRFWPWPYGRRLVGMPLADAVAGSSEKARATAAASDEHLRTLYVALTRARDVLVLPARPASGGGLRHAGLDPLFAATGFALPGDPGVHEVAVGDGTIPIETRTFLPDGVSPAPDDAAEVWFAPGTGGGPYAPAQAIASGLPPLAGAGSVLETVHVGRRLTLVGDPEEERLGNCLHGFLAADDAALPEATRLSLAADLLERHGLAGAALPDEMVRRSDELRATLGRLYPVSRWHREWPILLRQGKTVVTGFADLILDTEAGWVVIDHKSFKGRRDQWAAKAAEYTGQLAAYAGAMRAASGREVVGVWVHFVVGGGLVRMSGGGGG